MSISVLIKTSWRHLENIFLRCLQVIFKKSSSSWVFAGLVLNPSQVVLFSFKKDLSNVPRQRFFCPRTYIIIFGIQTCRFHWKEEMVSTKRSCIFKQICSFHLSTATFRCKNKTALVFSHSCSISILISI